MICMKNVMMDMDVKGLFYDISRSIKCVVQCKP